MSSMTRHQRRDFEKEMKAFVRERNEALFSLDREKIERYMKKYHIEDDLPFTVEDEEVFWASIHKAILEIRAAPPAVRARSEIWLKEHGYRPLAQMAM